MVNKITKNLLHIFLISLVGTFIFDLLFTHFVVFENFPDILSYFIAIKLIPSFIFMAGGYLLFRKNHIKAWFIAIPISIFLFTVFVQGYYSVICVPLMDGGEFCLNFLDSFKGLPQHFFDFIASWIIVTLIFRKWKI